MWGPDALLTPTGIQQAQNLSVAWRQQATSGAPLPQTFYASPLTRATDTLNITWTDFVLNQPGAPVPVIIEGLRETIVSGLCSEKSRGAEGGGRIRTPVTCAGPRPSSTTATRRGYLRRALRRTTRCGPQLTQKRLTSSRPGRGLPWSKFSTATILPVRALDTLEIVC